MGRWVFLNTIITRDVETMINIDSNTKRIPNMVVEGVRCLLLSL